MNREELLARIGALCAEADMAGFKGPAAVLALLHGAVRGEGDRIAEGRTAIDVMEFASRVAVSLLRVVEEGEAS